MRRRSAELSAQRTTHSSATPAWAPFDGLLRTAMQIKRREWPKVCVRSGRSAIGGSAPALEQVLVWHLPSRPGGNAHHHAARLDVGGDDGAGGDEGLLADLDRRADDDPGTDSAGAAQ